MKADSLKHAPQPASSDELTEKINEMGFGYSQFLMLLCCGGILFAEGSEVLVMGCVTKLISDQWKLTALLRAAMTAIVFVGFAIGNLIAGNLGDRFGRRLPILVSYIIIGVAGFMTSLTTEAVAMAAIRTFVGIGCGIGFPNVYAFIPEIVPTNMRGVVSALMIGFMPMGECFAAIGVFAIDNNLTGGQSLVGYATWRALIQYSALPAFAFFILSLFLLTESPHYLLTQGRIDELDKTIAHMAWLNGLQKSQTFFTPPAETKPILKDQLNSGGTAYSWTDAMCRPFGRKYVVTTLVLLLAHFTKDFSVFGLNYVFPQYFQNLTGPLSVGIRLILISLLAVPGVVIAVFLSQLDSLGNRTAISLTACVCSIFSMGLVELFNAGLCAYVVKFCAMAYFILTVVYTTEVFPTSFRVTAVGLCTSVGRLGSIGAPLFFELSVEMTGGSYDFFWILLAILMASTCLLACAFLKLETKGMSLTESDDKMKLASSGYASTA